VKGWLASVRITMGLDKRTITPEELAEPPMLAAVGAVRWTKRNDVMNGADPCASAVSTDDVRVRHAGGGAGLSSGLAAIVRPLCEIAGRLRSWLSKPSVETV
jgi:hypothetical protein